jgi:hypothetical protein
MNAREKFISILDNKFYTYRIIDGIIEVEYNKEGIPHLDLSRILEIPDNVTFINEGNLWLDSVTEIGDNVTFNNRGALSLPNLEYLNPTTKFNNIGFIDLRGLKQIPDGFEFNNNKGVYLLSLRMDDVKNVSFEKNTNVAFEGLDTREWDCSIPGIINGRLLNSLIRSFTR